MLEELGRGYMSVSAFEKEFATTDIEAKSIFVLLKYFVLFEAAKRSIPETDEKILEVLNEERLLEKSKAGLWNITNLGALCFANMLSYFNSLLEKAVRVIIYKGTSRESRVSVDHIFDEGYIAAFEKIIDYIFLFLPDNEEIIGVFRRTTTMYPKSAIRKLVADAIVNQDFTLKESQVTIEIFSDRIEITTPGSSNTDTGRRNESMLSTFRQLGLLESTDSYEAIFKSIRDYNLPEPIMQKHDSFTRVIIRNQ